MIASVLVLLVAAESPLACFEPLIGGQWIASSKLPNGEEMRTRTVWSWGAAKRVVRLRQFAHGREGEIQRYETILAYDAANKRIVYRVFSTAGLIARGTARAEEGAVVLEQPPLENFPAMRTTYVVGKDDTCIARVSFRTEDGWKQRVESTMRRTKLREYKQLDPPLGKNPLRPLASLAGTWEHRTKKDASVRAVTVGAWSLHRHLLRFVDSWSSKRGLEPFLERYVSFDPKSGRILVFLVDKGGFFEGTVTKEENGLLWRISGTDDRGKSVDARFRCRPVAAGRQAWSAESREDGEWVEGVLGQWWSDRKEGE